MHQWLFSIEFPELLFLLKRPGEGFEAPWRPCFIRSGEMIIWTKEKKLRYFKDDARTLRRCNCLAEVRGENVDCFCRAHPNSPEADSQQLEELVAKVLDGQDELKLAMLEEMPLGDFGQAALSRFRKPPFKALTSSCQGYRKSF